MSRIVITILFACWISLVTAKDFNTLLLENKQRYVSDNYAAIRWAQDQLKQIEGSENQLKAILLHQQLASFYYQQKKFDQCLGQARQAFSKAKKAPLSNAPMAYVPPLIQCHWKLTVDSRLDKQLIEELEGHFRKSPDKTQTPQLYLMLGRLYFEQKQTKEALEYSQRVLHHPHVPARVKASAYRHLASILLTQNGFLEAKRLYELALAIDRREATSDEIIDDLIGLASANALLFRYQQAIDYLEQALRLTPINYSPKYVKIIYHKGMIALRQKKHQQAAQAFKQGLLAANKIGSSKYLNSLKAGLGISLIELGDYQNGKRLVEALWQKNLLKLPSDAFTRLDIGLALAKANVAEGDTEQGITILKLLKADAKKNSDYLGLKTISLQLANIFQSQQQLKLALTELSELTEQSESMINKMVDTRISDIKTQYAISDKNQSQSLLNKTKLVEQHKRSLDYFKFQAIGIISVLILIILALVIKFKNLRKELVAILKRQKSDITKLNQSIERLAVKDHLTGLYNRQAVLQVFEEFVQIAKHKHTNTCLLMIVVDKFRQINENYGHDCGDFVLKRLAGLLSELLPNEDLLCRWSGEEFIVILPDTSKDHAYQIANQLRRKIANSRYNYVVDGKKVEFAVTITGALVECSQANSKIQYLVNQASHYIDYGKNNGRNCIISDEEFKKASA